MGDVRFDRVPDEPLTGAPGLTRRALFSSGLAAVLAAHLRPAGARASGARHGVRSVILLYMNGGPSQIDTFDPKPGTPNGGPFKATSTSISGARFSEHLPGLAERAHRLAVIRTLTSTEGSHARARYLLHSAYSPNPSVRHASLGATVSHELGDRTVDLPGYVSLGGPGEGSGFLGPDHGPFIVSGHPGQPIENLRPWGDMDAGRLDARLSLAASFDADFARRGAAAAEVRAHQTMLARARRLMASPLVRAFGLDDEPAALRKAYGDSAFGGRCLIARRLVEAGVRAVEVELGGWDSHQDNFTAHRRLASELDPAMSALLDDLGQRGLLASTLVVWAGEFGRSPRINASEGRDHHTRCFCAVLAGAGVRAGQVVGATTEDGDAVASRPVTIPDLYATLLVLAGIDPGKVFQSNDRPISLGNGGKVIREVVA
jgi:hypothetical protein